MPIRYDDPSNDEVRAELMRQSHYVYGPIGLGGILGPTKHAYYVLRSPTMPGWRYLLDMYCLPRTAAGWSHMLLCFDLEPPTHREYQEAWWKRKELSCLTNGHTR